MRRLTLGIIGVAIGLSVSLSASACIWDTDTLANEAKGLPDVVQVVTGRFERNPPLFYEMRLQRVAAELAQSPERLNDYDDAGAACDRLSRDDEALAWMGKKRARLERADQNAATTKEQWYRYYANTGTFRIHRWLRAGADRARIGEVKQARNEIAKAIAIHPDAHFGREQVQLALMDWLIAPDEDPSSPAPPAVEILGKLPAQYDTKKVSKGVCGLIVLGNAWESVDSFVLLADRHVLERPIVQYLAGLRATELVHQGHHSLHPERFSDAAILSRCDATHTGVSGGVTGEIEEQYRQLRAEADAWQKRRTDYMLARLQAGHHPDTDPTFWNGWKDTPPPSLAISWPRFASSRFRDPLYLSKHFGDYIPVFIGGGVVLWFIGRIRKRRKAAIAATRTAG